MKENGVGRLIKVAKVGKRESEGKKGYRKHTDNIHTENRETNYGGLFNRLTESGPIMKKH